MRTLVLCMQISIQRGSRVVWSGASIGRQLVAGVSTTQGTGLPGQLTQPWGQRCGERTLLPNRR